MKTSEFIRNAVDACLQPEPVKHEGRWLCNCMTTYYNASPAASADNYDKAMKLIRDCLGDLCHPQETIMSGLLSRCRADEDSEAIRREIQNIRFMASEFLALYLEDEGD